MSVLKYDNEKLIKDVREFMEVNSLNIKEFSKKAGIDPAIISKILNRKYVGSDNNISSICLAINEDVANYITGNVSTNDRSVRQITNRAIINKDYDYMSIEELGDFIANLQRIRNRRINEEIEKRKKEIIMYENLLKEDET